MMPSYHRSALSSQREKDRRNLDKKFKRDKADLEKRIAQQTKEFESERRRTERRLKMWMDPKNSGVFERRLRRLMEREAKALGRRLSHKVESITKERRDLQSRLVWFGAGKPGKQNGEDCMRKNDEKIRDLLKKLQGDPDSRRSKKKRRIVILIVACGNG